MPGLLKGTLETILVVDDDELVLRAVASVLENANFRVHSTNNGYAALELAKNLDGRIDLLISDVTMPHISGPDLGEALKKQRPDMRVMLISGEESGNILVLNYGWAYIKKPFVALKLIALVNEVLHSVDRSQPGGQGFDTRLDTRKDTRRDKR